MFETAAELWIKYLSQVSDSWPKADARHNLANEVNNRLHQLDHILKRLHDACDTITASPSAAQQDVKQRIANRLRLANGEITHEEFIRGSLSLDPDPVSCMDAWDD